MVTLRISFTATRKVELWERWKRTWQCIGWIVPLPKFQLMSYRF